MFLRSTYIALRMTGTWVWCFYSFRDIELPFPKAYYITQELLMFWFDIIEGSWSFIVRIFEMYSVFVYFVRIIDWEFPYLKSKIPREPLFKAQKIIEQDGVIKGKFIDAYFVARKVIMLKTNRDLSKYRKPYRKNYQKCLWTNYGNFSPNISCRTQWQMGCIL